MTSRVFVVVKQVLRVVIILSVTLPVRLAYADEAIVAASSPTPSINVTPSPPVLVSTVPDVVMTAFSTGDQLDLLELYNQSVTAVDLGQMSVVTTDSFGAPQTISLRQGWLLPKHYVTFTDSSAVVGVLAFGVSQRATMGDIAKVGIMRQGIETQSVDVPSPTNYAWAQHKQRGNATIKQTGIFATDFNKKTANSPASVMSDPLYQPPITLGGLALREVHANPVACAPDAASALDLRCGDYVKVVNGGDGPVNLASFRLRVGKFGDTAGIASAFLWQQSSLTADDEYILESGEMLIVHLRDDLRPIALSASGNYVWIEDAYGVKTYSYVAYPDLTAAQYREKSWGFDTESGVWLAANPSPDTIENDFVISPDLRVGETVAPLKPCRDGQYRSEETGHCRNIALAGETLTACKDGQYRSEETNRCRSLVATVAASLKPCADDQFRNPETGRCKKIASSEDGPAPCDVGWERNPETNRCRKIKVTDMPLASFPVEPIKKVADSAVVWWALGGAGVLAASYGAWEWRREVSGVIRRAVDLIRRRQ